jgi:hypothetical protein
VPIARPFAVAAPVIAATYTMTEQHRRLCDGIFGP